MATVYAYFIWLVFVFRSRLSNNRSELSHGILENCTPYIHKTILEISHLFAQV